MLTRGHSANQRIRLRTSLSFLRPGRRQAGSRSIVFSLCLLTQETGNYNSQSAERMHAPLLGVSGKHLGPRENPR